jgi:hypothetical protein
MIVKISFALNKLYILGIALIEQFFKNLQRFAKVRNRNVLLIAKFFSLKMMPKYKPTAFIL